MFQRSHRKKVVYDVLCKPVCDGHFMHELTMTQFPKLDNKPEYEPFRPHSHNSL